MSIGKGSGFDDSAREEVSGSSSFRDELFNAASSTEAPSFEHNPGDDPVINVNEADVGEEDDGSEQGSAEVAAPDDAGKTDLAKTAEKWLEFKANGKNVRFNIADEEALKRTLPLAHGARQWQAERDSWKNKYNEVEKPYNDLKSNWDKLETAYKQDGIDGVLDILGGKQGYSKEHWEKKYQERLQYEKAPEHEQRRIEYEQRLADLERLSQRKTAEADALQKKFQERQEAELEAQVIADLRPHYNKYRFDGKLGDAEMEKEYNGIVWDKTSEALAKLSQAGETLNASLIEMEFKKVHDRYAKVLRVNQEQAASKAIETTKKAAKQSLASSVRSETAASAAPRNKPSGSSASNLSSTWAKMFGVK